MSAALAFLAAKLRALWHARQGHHVSSDVRYGRVRWIYCDECHQFLWVRE